MRSFTIAFLTVLMMAASPLHAASNGADTQSSRSERESKKPPTRDKRPPDSKDYTQQCKEEARGLRGPERSRFMTKCLKRH